MKDNFEDEATTPMTNPLSGNPILQGRGVCDPHIRIFNDTAYLYATHDQSFDKE
jgi:hypothetical protein